MNTKYNKLRDDPPASATGGLPDKLPAPVKVIKEPKAYVKQSAKSKKEESKDPNEGLYGYKDLSKREAIHQYLNEERFEDFDPVKTLEEFKNFSCMIVAKRGSGKTLILKDMLSKIGHWYSEAYVFSNTADLQTDNFDYIQKYNIIKGFDVEKLTELHDKQYRLALDIEKKGLKKETHLPYMLLLFDDVIGDNLVRTDKVFSEIFIHGRHSNICVIVLSQEVGGRYGINKVCRTNCDLVISFFPSSEYDRELIAQQFLSTENKKLGLALINHITLEPFTSITIFNRKSDRDYRQYVYRYKGAEKVPHFEIGTALANPAIMKRKIEQGLEGLGYNGYQIGNIKFPRCRDEGDLDHYPIII